jgi:hypothetical protein
MAAVPARDEPRNVRRLAGMANLPVKAVIVVRGYRVTRFMSTGRGCGDAVLLMILLCGRSETAA